MRTVIGQGLNGSRARLSAAAAIAAAVVVADFAFAFLYPDNYMVALEGRCVMAIIGLTAQIRLVNGDLLSVGLDLTPTQGWRYWVRVSLLIGLALPAFVVLGFAAWVLSGRELPISAVPPTDAGSTFFHMCVFSPIQEEAIYRLTLCVPLAVLLRPWGAIAMSGLVFGGLHWVYGTPSPENLLGGFLLAWAYLKSQSIAVPVLLHALGNLFALAAQICTWYWLQGAV